jgi:antirestriction protein ArdC
MWRISMATTPKAYDIITDRIVAALEAGVVPWRKPWKLQAGMWPQRNITGQPYHGINTVVLGMAGYSDPRWFSYKKSQELGGNVKGQKGTPIVFYRLLTFKDKDKATGKPIEKTIPLLKYSVVFNAEQCEGIRLPAMAAPVAFDAIAAAEGIMDNMPNRPSMANDGGDQAYYRPATDSIHLPPRASFDGNGEYYATAFHELGHATGHKSRLNRHGMETGIAPFGSPTYSREELAAEFCAAFLCNHAGIDNTIENSTAYIQSWARRLREDKRLVITAASQGQKAADYIRGKVS